MNKIKVAIAGIGDCASALVQGVEYYKNVDEKSDFIPGMLYNTFGSYRIKDIEFVAAFDVDKNKVGKDLSEAIFTKPNCAMKFCDVPNLGVRVERGPLLDGLGEKLRKVIPIDTHQKEMNVANVLRETNAEFLINFLPTGSKKASEFYAEQALIAGCGFINAIPEFIASDAKWGEKFKNAGLPLAGDDIKSQVGATIVHRTLIDLFIKRGVKIEESYQLNIGGNTDFYNLSEETRAESKLTCKYSAIQSLIPYKTSVIVAPPNYVNFLGDNKICYIRLKGRKFGMTPITIDLKMSVEDSPNSAGVIIDVIRAMKIALDRGISGPLIDICAYYFKNPPVQYPDDEAYRKVKKFVEDN
jgi:myo-inositol-1-phosphate synthase